MNEASYFSTPGVAIPIFTECDITFIAHFIALIVSDCTALLRLKKIRNNVAHDARVEIETDDELDAIFQPITEAVDKLFERHEERRQHWGKNHGSNSK